MKVEESVTYNLIGLTDAEAWAIYNALDTCTSSIAVDLWQKLSAVLTNEEHG